MPHGFLADGSFPNVSTARERQVGRCRDFRMRREHEKPARGHCKIKLGMARKPKSNKAAHDFYREELFNNASMRAKKKLQSLSNWQTKS